ncbi:condensation domain-containing protein, partial [Maribacter sp. 2307UL18-2]|uniref:condensation domain-containing protein n=1 Tax=Maribacter sp. 2307UL18-2 TaxID=3386274 RepID=UPI0039BC3942
MEKLLKQLKDINATIRVENGDLKLKFPKNNYNSSIIDEIKYNKKELIEFINKRQEISDSNLLINKALEKEYYRLSSVQKRLYFLCQLNPSSLVFNLSQIVEIEGDIDKVKVENTFKKLIDRHESLRTSIQIINGEAFQKISDNVEFSIEYSESTEANSESVITKFIRPFDLGEAPLLRVGLVKLKNKSHLLLVDVHHIIADGISMSILIKHFMDIYNHKKLPQVKLHYKDYAEWQETLKEQKQFQKQRDFWLREFVDNMSIIDLPVDFSRPSVRNYSTGLKSFVIDIEKTKCLRLIEEEEEATMFMVLFSILIILLSKLSNQDDVTVGTGIANRNHVGLDSIIGMFVNVIALRNHPKGSYSFKEFLTTVRTKTLSAFENQSYP